MYEIVWNKQKRTGCIFKACRTFYSGLMKEPFKFYYPFDEEVNIQTEDGCQIKFEEDNNMQEAVLKIQKLGVPPEGFEDCGCPEDDGFPSDETLDLWDDYQNAVVTISQPITWEEAEILIKCCPTDRMAGVEWSLLHCIESCISNRDLLETPGELEKYKSLIEKCNSDMMKGMLLERLESYLSKHN